MGKQLMKTYEYDTPMFLNPYMFKLFRYFADIERSSSSFSFFFIFYISIRRHAYNLSALRVRDKAC